MSTLLMDGSFFTSKTVSNYHRSQVLKSKENIFKPKCNKALKKKLKKYKLRRDGQEDPDIIDVSQTLITSLRIKSPNNQPLNSRKASETTENRPHNYLTKMVRLKKAAVMDEALSTDVRDNDNHVREENISLTTKGDEDKKQTDAFKLLMDSRNKSIGNNSPGKEKCLDETEAQERIEKKEIKAKRNLSLKKMAQAKGSMKKIEIEEYREQSIKRKMEDRAERLKDMIVNVETKNKKKEMVKPSNKRSAEKIVSPLSQEVVEDKDTLNNKSPILKTFDIFKDIKESPTKNIKTVSKEDEEFLKKLSPSIRKKENMLCYFQKLTKDSETLRDDDDIQNADQLMIKVKLKSKTKVKKKKHKYISDKEIDLPVNNDIILNNNPQSHSSALNNNNHKRKRRANNDKDKNEVPDTIMYDHSGLRNDDRRPKRNTKKPVKYADDFQLTSSDEELHIITPKKKRKENVGNNLKPINDKNFEQIKNGHSKLSENDIKCKPIKTKEIKNKAKCTNEDKAGASKGKTKEFLIPKKVTKLAPIFVAKPQLDPAALKAKQNFLHSGVPSQLKKNSIQQTNTMATDDFQTVVHVQSLCNTNTVKINNSCNFIDITDDEDIHLRQDKDQFKKLLDFTILKDQRIPIFHNNVDLTLEDIKKSYPRFPVYRTYHLLKGKSKGEFKDCVYPDLDNSVEIYNNMVDINNINPDKLNWTDKYKPTTQKQVIGNFESIRELKRWLVTWTENDAKSKKNKDKGSDSSDFYHSDTDSRETMRNTNNLLVITGKVGTGKTLSVYAVAAELAIKVIEVNASTRRTGKIMLQDLQEATQSHKVDRGKSNTESSQKSQEIKTCDNKLKILKKRGRKKKIPVTAQDPETKSVTKKESTDVTVRLENIRTGMSLILIDDADIVFDQDDGFCSAIAQLIQTSKRPVILVTSSLTCPHLQKFIHLAKIIKMRPFLPRLLGTWLDIMCLVDNNMCSPGLGAKTLDLFKGDIRKTINYLQFYMTSQKHLCNASDSGMSQAEAVTKLNPDDENSCMSWMDNEGWGASNSDDNSSKCFVRKQLQLLHSFSTFNNLNVWWNLPNLLNYSSELRENEKIIDKVSKRDKSKDMNEMNMVSGVLETISMTDYLENFNTNNEVHITSEPWYSCESASVIDNENFTSYNRNNDCINHIGYELLTKGVSEAQRVLECENTTEVYNPGMAIQRERDRVASQYKTLTSYLSPSAILDRRALALDYWPSCRNICRTEKSKTDNNSKRNNRFCHYLKSLNVLGRNEYFDNLGEGLINSNKE